MFGYEVRDGISIQEQFHGKVSKFDKEIELAKDFVLKSTKPELTDVKCPVCGARNVSPFFEKWGLQYYICTESWTVFAPSRLEEVRAFETKSRLADLRKSIDYQDVATENRRGVWKSLLDWMEHRVFRYSGKVTERKALVRGIRYKGLLSLLQQSDVFTHVDVKGSIITPDTFDGGSYDTLFYLDTLQRRTSPLQYLEQANGLLNKDGLLFLNTRIGSGFDVLALKGQADTIFPYEHIFLPSVKGLSLMLEKAGFEILEASTPGMFDTALVYKHREVLAKDDYFSRFLTSSFNERLFADYQKLLQKHGLSSTVRIVAVKK